MPEGNRDDRHMQVGERVLKLLHSRGGFGDWWRSISGDHIRDDVTEDLGRAALEAVKETEPPPGTPIKDATPL